LKLRRQLADQVGPEDANKLIANLSADDAQLESLGLVAGLGKLARGEISKTAYLENYGHRGPHEFELSVPRPVEDQTWLNQEIASYQQSPVDVDGLLAKQRQSFQAAWDRLQLKSPGAANGFRRRIAESVRRARVRELARSAYIRDRWSIRLWAKRAGELTGLGEQVFYLTLDEILRALDGEESLKDVISMRIAAYNRYKSLPSYPAVISGRFDPFEWAADPDRPMDIFGVNKVVSKDAELEILLGSPGSAGLVEGTVRVIRQPEEGDRLQQGEIMVAVQTDIAWTLLFPRATGVITDIGAPLSHAAIVARELGIPAVVGCGNATAILHTGDRVRLDGARGRVQILERTTSMEAPKSD
jgi:pyruvate,water dikinase